MAIRRRSAAGHRRGDPVLPCGSHSPAPGALHADYLTAELLEETEDVAVPLGAFAQDVCLVHAADASVVVMAPPVHSHTVHVRHCPERVAPL